MSSRKFLLPLAGLLAICLAIAGWASRPVSADVASVTVSSSTPPAGTPVTITVNLTGMAAGQSVTLLASAGTFGGAQSATGTFSAATTGVTVLTYQVTTPLAGGVAG